ncbi:MAG: hypothetical protein MR216_06120 [Bacteroidales bacterium]|nr:hypothetical protein [Bacteroidales bacterium]
MCDSPGRFSPEVSCRLTGAETAPLMADLSFPEPKGHNYGANHGIYEG